MTPQTIAGQLQQDILKGLLPPGTALSQSELAARFQVSRIPIRDALAQLATMGLINASPNRTATVLSMSRAQITEAYDLRVLLECDLMTRAIQQMTEQHLNDIDYALERSGLEARNANWAEGDQMFHTALYAAANRPRQTAMVDQLRSTCRIQIAAYSQLTKNTERWMEDHKALSAACHAGNIERARACLKAHLQAAHDALLDVVPEDAPANS